LIDLEGVGFYNVKLLLIQRLSYKKCWLPVVPLPANIVCCRGWTGWKPGEAGGRR